MQGPTQCHVAIIYGSDLADDARGSLTSFLPGRQKTDDQPAVLETPLLSPLQSMILI